MKVSILTVCLNSEKTILDTIKSVQYQTYDNTEHIVFDGGSTDETTSIAKSFEDKIRLVEGRDTGIFDAFNQALEYATGDIIGILNSDDYYVNNHVLELVVNTFKTVDTDSVYGDLDYVHYKNKNKITRRWIAGEFDIGKFEFGWVPPHPTFFVKRDMYKRYGAFNQSFKTSGDYELMLRMLYKNRISTRYIPNLLVKMRTNGRSDGSIFNRMNSLKEDYLSWKLNNLKLHFYTIPLKPLRKLPQFFKARLT